jgi:hypothetical protein
VRVEFWSEQTPPRVRCGTTRPFGTERQVPFTLVPPFV